MPKWDITKKQHIVVTGEQELQYERTSWETRKWIRMPAIYTRMTISKKSSLHDHSTLNPINLHCMFGFIWVYFIKLEDSFTSKRSEARLRGKPACAVMF